MRVFAVHTFNMNMENYMTVCIAMLLFDMRNTSMVFLYTKLLPSV
jgi:hypothetical protein